MVVVELMGGLGNQLFQYAFGQRLANQWQVPLLVDDFLLTSRWLATLRNYTARPYELGVFGIDQPNSSPVNLAKSVLPFFSDTYLLREKEGFDLDALASELPAPRVFCSGYWQSESYFKPVESMIRRQLKFQLTPSDHSQRMVSQIVSHPNAVFVHVRRGDYISNANASQYHGFCGEDYYRRGLAYLRERVADAHFFIFSDDLPWVKRQLGAVLNPSTYVDGNAGPDSWQDMYLMQHCRHAIIANSSFSWWGAWLNAGTNRIVIAPRNWFAVDKSAHLPIVPPNWITL